MKFFNTGGVCHPDRHYMLPSYQRFVDEGVSVNVERLIHQRSYFVIHAPRQVGKTTAMREFAKELTASGKYIAVLVSMEVGYGLKGDLSAAELAILDSWRPTIKLQLPPSVPLPDWPDAPPGQRIGAALTVLTQSVPLPLVVFLDEIDALQYDVLVSVLRQLRAGYNNLRPTAFPVSLALIGLRDVRDYKVKSGGSELLSTTSPFNIAVRSMTLRNFNADEVRALLRQHTTETGQLFTDEAAALIYELTQGQPWLVNSLASICVEDLVTDLTYSIEAAHVEQAKENLIARRHIHFRQLTDKLNEERVRRVIAPMLAGDALENVSEDDRQYVIDLGLARRAPFTGLEVANAIYSEVIPRTLAGGVQDSFPHIAPSWLNADGSLNAAQLLQSFLAFWRQHGEPLLRTAAYHEIAPHLVLMAFLHRVANGGGTLEREYAVGSGRMDLLLRYGATRLGIELKVWRDGRPDPLAQGLEQLDEYLQGLNLPSGGLVLFDQRSGQPPISERTTTENAVTPTGRAITVIRA